MSNILDKIKLSGVTYDIVDSTAIHSMDGYWDSGTTQNAITAATNALAESIAEQHYQTSGDVQNAISGKVDTDTYTAYTAATEAVISGKADYSGTVVDVDAFTYRSGSKPLIQVGVKKGGESGFTSKTLFTVGSGLTLNGSGSAAGTLSVDTNTIAQKTDIPSVSGYADSVKYNSTSKYVEFYHGGTGGTKVFEYDASPFLIDGMVQNVEIKDVTSGSSTVTCLVISFNTDAGKQDINIPISQIFDASNYYTKTETDNAITAATNGLAVATAVTQEISAAVSGKVDNDTYTAYTAATDAALAGKASTGTVNTINDVLTGHTADTTIHVTSTDKTTWSGKQDALVSGTNIKTINNQSILGSGNIDVQTLPTVTGTTLVFS